MAKSIREAYGEALVEYGAQDQRVVVLDADVSASTKSGMFAQAFPERFFNVGIAEMNMVGIASGLAACGKIPFANTFAAFMSTIGLVAARAFGSYSLLNIKLVGAYSGLSDAFDGASHQSLEDIAVMRSLPHFEVYVASDETLTRWLVKNAIQRDVPMYIRLSRDSMPPLYSKGDSFFPGKAKVLRQGEDVTVIACGILSGFAMQAAERLQQQGIQAEVIDLFCIKPIDKEAILESIMRTKAVVTAEEHSILGGLGGAVAEVASASGIAAAHEFVGTQDCHGESGPYLELLEKYGLDAAAIEAACHRAIRRKERIGG